MYEYYEYSTEHKFQNRRNCSVDWHEECFSRYEIVSGRRHHIISYRVYDDNDNYDSGEFRSL
ncbi:6594_t:CDS:2 [Funneliformis caledonium]|uniref:6594_t:CDS:1 n=1 Tax=Funneliformis caledonium TaxID=1117310 RepID=A0A9N8V3J3_9GLOM|nr:6594_t:CDS:2 [Funneliformis caledonium]